jgi:hypothetical protein
MWNINSTSKRLLNGNQAVIRSESLKKQYLAGSVLVVTIRMASCRICIDLSMIVFQIKRILNIIKYLHCCSFYFRLIIGLEINVFDIKKI